MRAYLVVIAALFAVVPPTALQAQIANVPALSEPGALPLYPGDRVGSARGEVWTKIGPMTVIRNVTRPLVTPFLPAPGKATGAAVILAPGGGMLFLAMPDEAVARTLVARGVAVFLLKYRVVATPTEIADLRPFFAQQQERAKRGEPGLANPEGIADGQAAVALVRANAVKWGVDPRKVGMLGFSSGAEVARAAALSDRAEGRPDFVGLIYGAMGAVPVPPTAPPMFAAIAMDDATVSSTGFPIVEAWRKARRPVELHAYQAGGHGFAQGGPNATHRRYLDQFAAWMAMQGFLSSAPDEAAGRP